MKLEHFVDDDPGYEAWLAAHSTGFVVNARRTPSPEYLRLHRAGCFHITRLLPGYTTWTSGAYRKVCSSDLAELERWAAALDGTLKTACYCLSN